MRKVQAMNKMALVVIICISAVFAISGCKKKEPEKEPDHIREKREQEQKKAAAKKKAEAAGVVAKDDDDDDHQGHGHGTKEEPRKRSSEDFDEEEWPAAVLEGYRWAFKSGIAEAPEATRQLALIGLPASKAMRRIISHHRLPIKKRAFMAMMFVQLHMFRVKDLAGFLEDKEMPMVQRAAIEALCILGTDEANDALNVMMTTLKNAGEKEQEELRKKSPNAPNPYAPLLAFVAVAKSQAKPIGMSAEQLTALDRVYQSKSAPQLKEAIKGIKDMSYEPGMVMIMGSPVSSELVKVGAAIKLIELARKVPGRVLIYVTPAYPPMLRMASARFIVERGNKEDLEQMAKIASDRRDPMSPTLQDILISKPPLPKVKGM